MSVLYPFFLIPAHIKDAHSSVWYKFNDEVVEKQEGNKFKLGIEEDLAGDESNDGYQRRLIKDFKFQLCRC